MPEKGRPFKEGTAARSTEISAHAAGVIWSTILGVLAGAAIHFLPGAMKLLSSEVNFIVNALKGFK